MNLDELDETALAPDSNLPLRFLGLIDHLAEYLDARSLAYVYMILMALLANESIEDSNALILLSSYVQVLTQEIEGGGDPNESELIKDLRAQIDDVIF